MAPRAVGYVNDSVESWKLIPHRQCR